LYRRVGNHSSSWVGNGAGNRSAVALRERAHHEQEATNGKSKNPHHLTPLARKQMTHIRIGYWEVTLYPWEAGVKAD
jgi:hypothetical protein